MNCFLNSPNIQTHIFALNNPIIDKLLNHCNKMTILIGHLTVTPISYLQIRIFDDLFTKYTPQLISMKVLHFNAQLLKPTSLHFLFITTQTNSVFHWLMLNTMHESLSPNKTWASTVVYYVYWASIISIFKCLWMNGYNVDLHSFSRLKKEEIKMNKRPSCFVLFISFQPNRLCVYLVLRSTAAIITWDVFITKSC